MNLNWVNCLIGLICKAHWVLGGGLLGCVLGLFEVIKPKGGRWIRSRWRLICATRISNTAIFHQQIWRWSWSWSFCPVAAELHSSFIFLFIFISYDSVHPKIVLSVAKLQETCGPTERPAGWADPDAPLCVFFFSLPQVCLSLRFKWGEMKAPCRHSQW